MIFRAIRADSCSKVYAAFMEEGGKGADNGIWFTRALSMFNKVVTACFGMSLDPQFEDFISEIKEAYYDLGIEATTKV